MRPSRSLVAIEVGGTFTDAVLLALDTGEMRTAKVPSTPKNPSQGVLDALRELVGDDWAGVEEFVHGSTIATNTVLERKGATVGLVTTRGFRDILELQRGDKDDIYNLLYVKPVPLVLRSDCFEVTERLNPDGSVRVPLDAEELRALGERLAQREYQGLAICTIHSYANAAHEEQIREALQERLPETPILISAKVAPEFREYERASTSVMSAYVAPRVAQYLGQLATSLAGNGFTGNFFMMQSNGGVIPTETVRDLAINTFLSGPAAGVMGASHLAASEVDGHSLVTFDMGGTSTDVSLVHGGAAAMVPQIEIGGLPVRMSTIDITTVGAGGGSIAGVDRGGMLHVGPQSAGADPGPACYGWNGTEATVTDANVVLGIIRASQRIGTRIRVDGQAAEAAVARVADALGLGILDTAEAILKIADAHMIDAIRLVTTERGLDPRDHALVAFGGAGPLHAARLASALGMKRVIVPLNAGLVSAFGLVVAPLKRQVTMTAVRSLEKLSTEDICRHLGTLEESLLTEFVEQYHLDPDSLQIMWELDLRYAGQGFELTLPVDREEAHPASIVANFHVAHQQRYGHARPHDPVDAVTWRVTAQVNRKDGDLRPGTEAATVGSAGESSVYWDKHWISARFVARATMAAGTIENGPLVIEESTSATFVPPGWAAHIRPSGNLLLEGA